MTNTARTVARRAMLVLMLTIGLPVVLFITALETECSRKPGQKALPLFIALLSWLVRSEWTDKR